MQIKEDIGMLGRLLRTSSFADLLGGSQSGKEDGKGAQHPVETTPPPPIHIPDELKLLLYGCKKIDGGWKVNGAMSTFRLVVAQELGQMMSRDNYQVVLDCSCSRNATMGPLSCSNGNVGQIPLSELKEYIFGSPVRISDRCQSDKIKLIKSARLIVVTRIFYNIHIPSTIGPPQRIAISCCIPECFFTVLTECWSQVSKWFDDCQKLLAPLLEADILLPKELKVSSPTHAESIFHKFYRNLIIPLHSLLESPRLFLYPEHSMEFTTAWYKEVFNWLEVKDGHKLKFLPALLAKVKYDSAGELTQNKASRIVIMSGNVIVANKLIFIVSAFLGPRYQGEIQFIDTDSVTPIVEPKVEPTDVKYISTITSKGWGIPRKRSTSSVLSKSSEETPFAHVFLPSSLRSTNSLQCISSSLNSQYGSYGSWFKKSMPLSHSPRASESPENPFLHQRNNSNSSLHQQLLGVTSVSGDNGSTATASTTPTINRWSQGSPSINEYEEYPWLGYGNTLPTTTTKTKMQKVNMPRNVNRVHDKKLLHDRFSSICEQLDELGLSTSPATESHGPVLEVPIIEDLSFPSQELLPCYASYMHNFDPIFQLQACPISSNTERKLLECMKDDLKTSDYSRTLLISLRSREIGEITMSKDRTTKAFIQRTKKIFQNGKQGNISQRLDEAIHFIDNHLTALWKKWEDPVDTDDKIKLLYESFRELIN
ncbi:Lst4p Ecym_8107 [Eremothecium cymbalariae DBVPG|uniref:Protein LST4 n=1 Tax=Eremothecium cymbalariae (strain CBS 270.75 / DBVPG 7215 / KCTC 17166 / NRRL Y-17582) TaxID=931890 RepID=G8JX27_ERECY|nr:Hypothetical protein Ecym_8107 [Eremothecium cymbalariae DBVPG\